ncbi:tellurite resistance/C4-dicarboxylate transporter family protein [Streptomyces sp. RY43-2]|uniref:Tellurite resistance/C4-dicarboxylate transporter family protein n=1 Tax=Streptomyces macrolidinus TaxID=2952607 RepID=A0ABT0ZMV0_9ACTN|nr:tellurite resistance/C4-dicarboxylate transporter family protein [Streptomyces macrolidinus]MCN9244912.1 tellurite resistance/C4-dicarboxylate transporter family protein [Streptomyces macrolidinus]
MSGTSALCAWWARRTPAAGAAVMATGIVSVGLHLAGFEVLSRVLLALTCAAWLGLAADFVLRLLRERDRWLAEAASPTAFTAVAATTVLGTRMSLLGGQWLAGVLLALAAVLWLGLTLPVVRHWGRRMPGSVFLGSVATEGIAVLGAVLATALKVAWLAHMALVFFWLGLVFYVIAFRRFDRRQVRTGVGDHWILSGALATSVVAGSKLIAAEDSDPYLWNRDDSGVLRTVTVALLILASICYCVLTAAELRWPRTRYDVRRWATVFPLGMTAVAALSLALALGVPWLHGLGTVLLWIAVAAWCAVLVGAARSAREDIRSTGIRSTEPR